jgi:uncharacterized protein (DUF433 family)
VADASGSKNAKAAIELDSNGVAWIRGKQVRVIEIVIDRLAHGGDVREIRSRFPTLTQKQVIAALDYFRDHRSEFQAEIERRWEQIRRLSIRDADSPFQRRLHELSCERFYARHSPKRKFSTKDTK